MCSDARQKWGMGRAAQSQKKSGGGGGGKKEGMASDDLGRSVLEFFNAKIQDKK
jgi:hypothetical protein